MRVEEEEATVEDDEGVRLERLLLLEGVERAVGRAVGRSSGTTLFLALFVVDVFTEAIGGRTGGDEEVGEESKVVPRLSLALLDVQGSVHRTSDPEPRLGYFLHWPSPSPRERPANDEGVTIGWTKTILGQSASVPSTGAATRIATVER